jgi:hypothetical protein
MSVKNLACIALLCALVAQSSQAAPSMSVVPTGLNAGNREWLVSITPDATLFADNPPNGVGGSVAVELAFSIDNPTDLLSVVIADPVSWPNPNPGNNPFTGGVFCCGTYIDLAADNTFAAYGSAYFTTGTPKSFLKITTAGSGATTLRYGTAASGNATKGNIIAQAGTLFTPYTGVVSVPEPASIAILAIAGLALAFVRRGR